LANIEKLFSNLPAPTFQRALDSVKPAVLDMITDFVADPMDFIRPEVALVDAALPSSRGSRQIQI